MYATCLVVLATVLFGLYTWDLLVSLAGFLPLAVPQAGDARQRRFACVVCAHDEERVIEGVVRSLRAQDYPAELVRVFVVADNCTDRTAAVAAAAGAEVLHREDPAKKTKGYALQWAMDRLLKEVEFDALAVFDADNAVAPDFLATVNRYLGAGHVAVQTYLDTKNPNDSWVTRSIAIAYHVTNRAWMRARQRLGLPATLGGTGFCLTREIVEKYRWDPGSLSEDLELAVKLTLDGVHVSFCPHTRIYDEKPPTLWPSFRQRMRWMQGHNDVAVRWVPRTLYHAVRHGSIAALDVALYLLQPIRSLLAFLVMAGLATAAWVDPQNPTIAHAFSFTVGSAATGVAVFVVYPLLIAWAEGVGRFALLNIVPYVLFSFTWIPAIVLGLARMRSRVWLHTRHHHPGATPLSEGVGPPAER